MKINESEKARLFFYRAKKHWHSFARAPHFGRQWPCNQVESFPIIQNWVAAGGLKNVTVIDATYKNISLKDILIHIYSKKRKQPKYEVASFFISVLFNLFFLQKMDVHHHWLAGWEWLVGHHYLAAYWELPDGHHHWAACWAWQVGLRQMVACWE